MDVIIGIDLGTTRCVIAHDTGDGAPVVIDAEDGSPYTPAVVHFDGERWEVGAGAALMAPVDPDSTVVGIKREMGGDTAMSFGDEDYGPEGISGIILRHLADLAEAELGRGRVRAVITVPAYFGAAEREATLSAARIAGIDCLGLLAEPAAASLAAIGTLEEGDTRLVYDLGGGTFDVTVIEQRGRGPASVVAVDGDCRLGGLDWDERLSDLILERWISVAADPEAEDDHDFLERLRGYAEKVKIALSRRGKAEVNLHRCGHQAVVTITREQFERVTADLLDKTVDVARRVLAAAPARQVRVPHEAVLVGGSSRMPQVTRAVAQCLGMRAVLRDPDTCVARGAAILARELATRRQDRTAGMSAAVVGTARDSFLTRSVLTAAPRQIGLVLRDSREPGGPETVVPVVAANEALPVRDRRISAATLAPDQGRAMVTLGQPSQYLPQPLGVPGPGGRADEGPPGRAALLGVQGVQAGLSELAGTLRAHVGGELELAQRLLGVGQGGHALGLGLAQRGGHDLQHRHRPHPGAGAHPGEHGGQGCGAPTGRQGFQQRGQEVLVVGVGPAGGESTDLLVRQPGDPTAQAAGETG